MPDMRRWRSHGVETGRLRCDYGGDPERGSGKGQGMHGIESLPSGTQGLTPQGDNRRATGVEDTPCGGC